MFLPSLLSWLTARQSNTADFSERVGALYSLAYAIKMNYKKTAGRAEFTDFTVYPLEGLFVCKEQQENSLKKNWFYTIMLGQPDFITGEMVKKALEQVRVKKPNPPLTNSFEEMIEEACVAMLHLGLWRRASILQLKWIPFYLGITSDADVKHSQKSISIIWINGQTLWSWKQFCAIGFRKINKSRAEN